MSLGGGKRGDDGDTQRACSGRRDASRGGLPGYWGVDIGNGALERPSCSSTETNELLLLRESLLGGRKREKNESAGGSWRRDGEA